jgi:hypothetical protein
MQTRQYILVEELPPGWTNEQRHAAHRKLKNSLGQQGGGSFSKTHSRPCVPTVLDEEGKIVSTANAWIIVGLFAEEELERSHIVDLIAEELSVNPVAVDAKIDYTVFKDADEARDFLKNNANDWGEVQQ